MYDKNYNLIVFNQFEAIPTFSSNNKNEIWEKIGELFWSGYEVLDKNGYLVKEFIPY